MSGSTDKQALVIFALILSLMSVATGLSEGVRFTIALILLYLPGYVAVRFLTKEKKGIEFHVTSFAIGASLMAFAMFMLNKALPITALTAALAESFVLFVLGNVILFRSLSRGKRQKKKRVSKK